MQRPRFKRHWDDRKWQNPINSMTESATSNMFSSAFFLSSLGLSFLPVSSSLSLTLVLSLPASLLLFVLYSQHECLSSSPLLFHLSLLTCLLLSVCLFTFCLSPGVSGLFAFLWSFLAFLNLFPLYPFSFYSLLPCFSLYFLSFLPASSSHACLLFRVSSHIHRLSSCSVHCLSMHALSLMNSNDHIKVMVQ